MKTVGMIPARFQSSRFPGKPLAMILDKPMIQHVCERASRANRLDRVIVATDDARILEAVERFGGEAILTRADHASGTDRIAEASRLLDLGDEDMVLNIQGDEPLVGPEMIHQLISALEMNPDCAMATLAFESHDEREFLNANVVKVVVDIKGRALYFSRSPIPHRRDAGQEPVAFLKHLGFYAYRQRFLQQFTLLPSTRLERLEQLEQLRALENGYPIQVALSPTETRGVDVPEDLEEVREKLRA